MKIYFVTIYDDQSFSLTKRGADQRMLSYFYVKKKRPGFLKDYVERGHGRYIDEEGEAIREMSHREFFTHFLSKYDLIEKGEA